MNRIIFALAILGCGAVSYAELLQCTLTAHHGAEETKRSHRGHVVVTNTGYSCDGSYDASGLLKVYMYEPGETDDGDATKTQTFDSEAVVVQGDGSCSCMVDD